MDRSSNDPTNKAVSAEGPDSLTTKDQQLVSAMLEMDVASRIKDHDERLSTSQEWQAITDEMIAEHLKKQSKPPLD